MKNADWELLKTLYTTKNLTQAARLLFITQPALTKRLQNIEKEFGCQVVQRSNKGVTFTVEGEYLAKQASHFVDLMEETTKHLQYISGKTQSVVRIGAPSSFTKYYLVDLLTDFHMYHPEITPQIRVDVSSEIPHYLHSNTIDCGFTLGESSTAFNAIRYDTQRCYAVYRTPITIGDLPTLPLILHNRNQSTERSIFQWYQDHFHTSPQIGIHVTDLDTALDMVANGLGYCLAFGSFLEKRPDFFLLPLNNLDHTPFLRDTWLLYSNSILANPYVKTFIDYAIQNVHHL